MVAITVLYALRKLRYNFIYLTVIVCLKIFKMKNFLKVSIFILINLVILSCSSESDDNNLKNSIGDYDEYFIADANGTELNLGFSYPINVNADYGGVTSQSGTSCNHDLGAGIYPYDNRELPYAGIKLVGYFDGLCGGTEENSVFNSLFPTGNYNISDGNNKGIYLDLDFDSESNEYYSTDGVEQPENSYVTITSSEESNVELTPGFYNFGQFLEGEFMVNMVNFYDSSDIIQVKGIFRLRLESYSQSRLD